MAEPCRTASGNTEFARIPKSPPSAAMHRAKCTSSAFTALQADAFLPAQIEFLEPISFELYAECLDLAETQNALSGTQTHFSETGNSRVEFRLSWVELVCLSVELSLVWVGPGKFEWNSSGVQSLKEVYVVGISV